MVTEWIAYLTGFGALEIIVVYPVLALIHAVLLARDRIRSAFALFIPAVAFSLVHFLLVPNTTGSYYALSIDRRLPSTLFQYFEWAIGPTRFRSGIRCLGAAGMDLGWTLIGVAFLLICLGTAAAA